MAILTSFLHGVCQEQTGFGSIFVSLTSLPASDSARHRNIFLVYPDFLTHKSKSGYTKKSRCTHRLQSKTWPFNRFPAYTLPRTNWWRSPLEPKVHLCTFAQLDPSPPPKVHFPNWSHPPKNAFLGPTEAASTCPLPPLTQL